MPVMVVLLWKDPTTNDAPGRVVCIVSMAILWGDDYRHYRWLPRTKMEPGFRRRCVLDPLADKLMVVTVLVMCVPHGWLPAWLVALLICRELTITGVRTIAVSEGLVLSASLLGKFKTATQATALGFLLWHHETNLFWLVEVDAHACGVMLMYLATIFSLWSAALISNSSSMPHLQRLTKQRRDPASEQKRPSPSPDSHWGNILLRLGPVQWKPGARHISRLVP